MLPAGVARFESTVDVPAGDVPAGAVGLPEQRRRAMEIVDGDRVVIPPPLYAKPIHAGKIRSDRA